MMLAHELRPGDVFSHGGLAVKVLEVDYASSKQATGALNLDPGDGQKLLALRVSRGARHDKGVIFLAGWMPVNLIGEVE